MTTVMKGTPGNAKEDKHIRSLFDTTKQSFFLRNLTVKCHYVKTQIHHYIALNTIIIIMLTSNKLYAFQHN